MDRSTIGSLPEGVVSSMLNFGNYNRTFFPIALTYFYDFIVRINCYLVLTIG